MAKYNKWQINHANNTGKWPDLYRDVISAWDGFSQHRQPGATTMHRPHHLVAMMRPQCC